MKIMQKMKVGKAISVCFVTRCLLRRTLLVTSVNTSREVEQLEMLTVRLRVYWRKKL